MPIDFQRRDVTLANWRTHPFNVWSFQNLSEIVPTARFSEPLPDTPLKNLDALRGFEADDGKGGKTDITSFLHKSHSDSFVVLRDGAVLAEWYAETTDPAKPHLVFSISKSITGMLAGIAAGDGLLDPDAPISTYLPVLPGSAYATATVRDLLDMTVGLGFVEDYLDVDGDFDRYRRAMLWNPERPGTTPETMTDVLFGLPPSGEPHGKKFYYASPNSDLLGLVVESATGRRYPDFLAERLWKPMGLLKSH